MGNLFLYYVHCLLSISSFPLEYNFSLVVRAKVVLDTYRNPSIHSFEKNGQINLALFGGEIPAVQSFYGFISKKEEFFTS